MLKNTEKYKRHEALTNTFLVQLAFAIGFAIYTFFLMKGSVMDAFMIGVRYSQRICFVAFALVAAATLFVWLKKGDKNYKAGFFYSLIFSFGNLYLMLYAKVASKLFGGFFYNIMYGEYKTLLTLIGVGTFVCFVVYVVRDNMPAKKSK